MRWSPTRILCLSARVPSISSPAGTQKGRHQPRPATMEQWMAAKDTAKIAVASVDRRLLLRMLRFINTGILLGLYRLLVFGNGRRKAGAGDRDQNAAAEKDLLL